ncbi:MAG: O-antigen ligase family protein, partial [Actinomycetota bacterium]|nr:O-antigen ligase family protein [Actinomycetota bacterium]
FASEWGLAALGFLVAAAVALIVRERLELGRLDLALWAALALLLGWTLLSAAWAPSPSQPVLEAERLLVYLAVAICASLVLTRDSADACLAGIAGGAGVVAAFALVERLVFDQHGGEPLHEPIGYRNAVGILWVLGLMTATRAGLLGAAAMPALATALALTFGRGALVALVAGAAVLAALEPRRFRVLALLPAPALAAGSALGHDALRIGAGDVGEASLTVVLVVAATTAMNVVAFRFAPRLEPGPRASRVLALALGAAAVFAASAAVTRIGDPVDAFRQPLPAGSGDLGARLISTSGNGRIEYWQVALEAFERNPLVGIGAGEYARFWVLERPISFPGRDAHSLYLEVLAELGLVGLVLLLAVVVVPVVALARARPPGSAQAAAAYTAFLVHAALDWDWEIPAVTATALLCGAVLVVLARPDAAAKLTARRRLAGAGLIAPLVVAAAIAHAGNRALAASTAAIERGDAPDAIAEARRARAWMPWSHQPWQRLGEARLTAGDTRSARADLREALARDAEEWSIWYDLALASRGDERRRAIARAASLNPLGPEIADLRAES